MRTSSQTDVLERVRALVGETFGVAPVAVTSRRGESATCFVVAVGRIRLAIDLRRDATTASVIEGAARARATAATLGRTALPVVFVPYAGRVAFAAASRESVGILDAAGNAFIRGGSVVVHIEGRPDPSPVRGRPRDAFAPRAARATAILVAHPDRRFTQRELAREAGLDEGRISRVLRRLIDERFVERDEDRRVRVVRRELLIEAYRQSRVLDRGSARSYSVASRSNEATVRAARELLETERITYAATDLLGAHAWTGRGTARQATFYVASIPSAGSLALAGFRPDDARGNVSFVVPQDDLVLSLARDVGGLRCAPKLDVYADLASVRDVDARLVVDLRALV